MQSWIRASICLALVAAGCAATTNPDIDPRADAALRRMSSTLAKAKWLKVHSVATMEQRTDSGQLAQFSRDSTVVVGRPDQMQADVRRGQQSHRIWHQGKELTILDVRQNTYATIETPQPLDDMFDFLAEQHGLVIPLDDLLYPNPYEALTERVASGAYVDRQDIGGRMCDHLLFTQDNVDWQVWIDTAEPAVPRKVVITYKEDPDRPQYEAVLDQWQFDPPADPAQFTPQVPTAARRVEIADLVGSNAGEKK
ncbi:MAG: DUF2092 domain-containing protein [Planctomycetaceae bacterium]|nr:DUF2092 domain-containing protein [Planctomycetaceae bacterium]